MKLVIIMSYGTGLETWERTGILMDCLKLIRSLSSLYSEVILITYDDSNRVPQYFKLLPRNVKALPKPKFLNKLFHSILTPLLKYRELNGSVLIRSWQLWGSWPAIIIKLLYGSKILLRQGFQFSKFVNDRKWLYFLATAYEKLAYMVADKIAATTKDDKKYIMRRYKVDHSKITVIPNWVDTGIFRPMKDVEKEAGRIIFVGRLEKQKNILALVRAVKITPDAKLYIFGSGSLEEEIRREIKGLDKIRLMGVVSHEKLPYELNKSEIFVLPSLYEGHPKALLEAMACGLPVIGSRVEGIREIIEDGVNGLLCDPTPEDIRNKIIRLLSDKDLRERLGRNAREYVVRNYSFERIFAEELKVHKELLSSSR